MIARIDRYFTAADNFAGWIGPYLATAALVAIALVFGDDIISAFTRY